MVVVVVVVVVVVLVVGGGAAAAAPLIATAVAINSLPDCSQASPVTTQLLPQSAAFPTYLFTPFSPLTNQEAFEPFYLLPHPTPHPNTLAQKPRECWEPSIEARLNLSLLPELSAQARLRLQPSAHCLC